MRNSALNIYSTSISCKQGLLGLFVLLLIPFLAFAQVPQPDQYNQLKYRHIGPDGNRMIAVIGVPGDPSTSLVGAASGGIWKTTD